MSITDGSGGYVGNDFGVDDISFMEQQVVGPHEFKYDYRSRRYYRGTPAADGSTDHMFSVFDGGLSVQEYSVATDSDPVSPSTLRTEFIRGEGMGVGVGGMVYSIKDDGNGGDEIICSHANHRGDVIARSDSNGSLTYFALYEAYGTRPYEWDDGVTGDPDRQKANTKEEEKDLDLLNEGMRYRDLETGVFLTRDPIGYGDGPNVYCYVHCNPITSFDPLGLEWKSTTSDPDESGNMHTTYEFTASLRFDDSLGLSPDEQESYRANIVAGIKDSFTSPFRPGEEGAPKHTWSINVNISVVSSAKGVSEKNHIIFVTADDSSNSRVIKGDPGSWGASKYNDLGTIELNHNLLQGEGYFIRFVAGHEAGHTAGNASPPTSVYQADHDNPDDFLPSGDQLRHFKNADGSYGSIMTSAMVWNKYIPDSAGERYPKLSNKWSREFKPRQIKLMNGRINGNNMERRDSNHVNKDLGPNTIGGSW